MLAAHSPYMFCLHCHEACLRVATTLPQDSAFVLELTYNYDVKGYRLGNDHVYFKIRNRVAYKNLEEQVRLGRGFCTGAAPGWNAMGVAPAAFMRSFVAAAGALRHCHEPAHPAATYHVYL